MSARLMRMALCSKVGRVWPNACVQSQQNLVKGFALIDAQDTLIACVSLKRKPYAIDRAKPFTRVLLGLHTRVGPHTANLQNNNAHPHHRALISPFVHNGIIENYESIRQELLSLGYTLKRNRY